MKRLLVPAAAVALLAAFLFWWFSPTQVVKRRSMTLLETLTLAPDTGKASRQAGVYSLNALLAGELELETTTLPEASGTFERAEIESTYSWLCEQAKQTRFELKHIDSLQVHGDHADIALTLAALVELPQSTPVKGDYKADLRWQREDNTWRLARASWEETPDP